jgi:hypothetical protein
MVRPDEERRARLYRAHQDKQAQARRARNAALRGSNAAVKAIRDGWEPVILARLEWAASDERDDDE